MSESIQVYTLSGEMNGVRYVASYLPGCTPDEVMAAIVSSIDSNDGKTASHAEISSPGRFSFKWDKLNE